MDINQIIIIVIIILAGIILVFVPYFLISFIKNRAIEKKVNTIFNPKNLVEEEPLLDMMVKKRNIEEEIEKETPTFIEPEKETSIFLNQKSINYQNETNAYSEDKSNTTGTDHSILEEEKKNNKFFK